VNTNDHLIKFTDVNGNQHILGQELITRMEKTAKGTYFIQCNWQFFELPANSIDGQKLWESLQQNFA
jgi:hypothetical protein